MNIVDANVLLYAVNEDAERHIAARDWLDGALNGQEPIGFTWTVLLAFIRLSTKADLFPSPLTADEATGQVEEWISQRPSIVVEPTPRHLQLFSGLLAQTGSGGNLTNDAHLAALATEHSATVVTFDNDFGRFTGVSWHMPDGRT